MSNLILKKELGDLPKYKKESAHFLGEDGLFNPLLDSGHNDDKLILKVPVHLRGFEVPSDIKSFLTELMPNMEIYVGSKLCKYTSYRGRTITLEIITHFMTYILGTCSSKNGGVKRYELYNPKKYSKIPYYRYIFSILGFFITKFRQAQSHAKYLESFHYSIEGSSFDGEESRSYMENKASLESSQRRIEEECIATDINVKCKSRLYLFVARVCSDDPKNKYSSLIKIYDQMLEGFTPIKISKNLGIASPIVSQNISKIKEILINEFPNLENDLRLAA